MWLLQVMGWREFEEFVRKIGNYRASVKGPLSTGVVGEYVDIILKLVIDLAKAVFPAGLRCPLFF